MSIWALGIHPGTGVNLGPDVHLGLGFHPVLMSIWGQIFIWDLMST